MSAISLTTAVETGVFDPLLLGGSESERVNLAPADVKAAAQIKKLKKMDPSETTSVTGDIADAAVSVNVDASATARDAVEIYKHYATGDALPDAAPADPSNIPSDVTSAMGHTTSVGSIIGGALLINAGSDQITLSDKIKDVAGKVLGWGRVVAGAILGTAGAAYVPIRLIAAGVALPLSIVAMTIGATVYFMVAVTLLAMINGYEGYQAKKLKNELEEMTKSPDHDPVFVLKFLKGKIEVTEDEKLAIKNDKKNLLKSPKEIEQEIEALALKREAALERALGNKDIVKQIKEAKADDIAKANEVVGAAKKAATSQMRLKLCLSLLSALTVVAFGISLATGAPIVIIGLIASLVVFALGTALGVYLLYQLLTSNASPDKADRLAMVVSGLAAATSSAYALAQSGSPEALVLTLSLSVIWLVTHLICLRRMRKRRQEAAKVEAPQPRPVEKATLEKHPLGRIRTAGPYFDEDLMTANAWKRETRK